MPISQSTRWVRAAQGKASCALHEDGSCLNAELTISPAIAEGAATGPPSCNPFYMQAASTSKRPPSHKKHEEKSKARACRLPDRGRNADITVNTLG